ncbi:MAG: hypothetical protein NTZ49_01130 [Candidatus Parcubacteria bacterium]|nr:hypothetical protein [Candidatus Parcubacteria bacterium]
MKKGILLSLVLLALTMSAATCDETTNGNTQSGHRPDQIIVRLDNDTITDLVIGDMIPLVKFHVRPTTGGIQILSFKFATVDFPHPYEVGSCELQDVDGNKLNYGSTGGYSIEDPDIWQYTVYFEENPEDYGDMFNPVYVDAVGQSFILSCDILSERPIDIDLLEIDYDSNGIEYKIDPNTSPIFEVHLE